MQNLSYTKLYADAFCLHTTKNVVLGYLIVGSRFIMVHYNKILFIAVQWLK